MIQRERRKSKENKKYSKWSILGMSVFRETLSVLD